MLAMGPEGRLYPLCTCNTEVTECCIFNIESDVWCHVNTVSDFEACRVFRFGMFSL